MSERQDQKKRERKAARRAAKKKADRARRGDAPSGRLVPQAHADALRARFEHTGATVYPAL